MALYINTLPNGDVLPKNGKVAALVAAGATEINEPSELQPNLICVVENDWADAACYVDIPRQLEICKLPDTRKKTWLIYPHAAKVAK